jgi:hypothetical protein
MFLLASRTAPLHPAKPTSTRVPRTPLLRNSFMIAFLAWLPMQRKVMPPEEFYILNFWGAENTKQK